MSDEQTSLDCIIPVCFLIMFSSIAIMAGPFGLMMVIFAVLVFINGYQKQQAKRSKAESEVKADSGPSVVTVDRRIVYQVPTTCPECGGSLSNEDVDWVGPLQAKCPYCRTTIEAQPAEF